MDDRDRTIVRVITEGGNKTQAAKVLGISRQAVQQRLTKISHVLDELETPEMRMLPALMQLRSGIASVLHLIDQDALDYSLELTSSELARTLAAVEPWAEELEWLIRREFTPSLKEAA